ncbi:MAG: trypsin-like serine protease [Armatimonadetes bacterium]|nr:trypsin-like serine protease [Armatimonadota bacterium]NIM24675.1 trypsin-like serine protease [Armatimonadota bacterium]NIM68554.1 trypsin-like serine protease [Armatimonadota bacterium]NIM76934.1 trypsin-like serine protease [Armatimonadota bacterium]NIN06748.1 trypsin-like serine protease [Armatimonadota bacterium]
MNQRPVRFPHFIYMTIIIILSVLLGVTLGMLGQAGGRVHPKAVAAMPVTMQGLETFEAAFNQIAEKAAPAVVNINTEQIVRRRHPMDELFEEFFGRRSPFTYRERVTNLGSGVIIRRDGYILTNVHVIAGADQIKVTLEDGENYQARVVSVSPRNDLAIIKIDAQKELTPAPLGDADATKVGSWAIAVGSPFGLTQTVTVGVISAKGRGEYRDLLQTDASINVGNSGGPLLNLRGEVIGVNQAILSPARVGNIGIGFAIPINVKTRQLIEEMLSG